MADIFKGYIPSNGKIPLYSVKSGKFLKEPPAGDYVGVLKEEYIQVDIDDYDLSRLVLRIVQDQKLRCDILQTTRGLHFYFKNTNIQSQKVGVYTAVGIPADIGLGSKDRVVPLRTTKDEVTTRIVNGAETSTIKKITKEREWLQTYDELEDLPCWLYPISTKDYGITKITTRNQSLFNYILTLQSHGLNQAEIRHTIKTINKYVLEQPLSDREIDTITREEAFSKELFFDEDGKFMHDRFGNYMLNNCNIVKIDNQVNIYTKNNLYSNDPMEFEKVMIDKISILKANQRKEVYQYIALKCDKEKDIADPRFVGLKSCIYDVITGEEYPYSPEFVISNKIPYSYNPTAYSEIMDKTLNKVACNDPQIRKLLEEMVGYCMYRKNSMQKCFILTGEGKNGKSTIINVIKHLLGKDNFVSLEPREMEQTYKPAGLHNKLANFGDDISNKYIDNASVFKSLVTGGTIQVERKYGQPFDMESYATQVFCANEMPRFNDTSDGFSRRLIMIPFNATFSSSDADYDPFIEEKLMSDEAMEYLLRIAIDGLMRLLKNKEFTTSDKAEEEKRQYLKINNPIDEWLDGEPKILNESAADVYIAYKIWCSDNGCTPLKQANVGRAIKKRFGYITTPVRIDNKSIRIYVEE